MPPTLSEMFIQGIHEQEKGSIDSASGAAVGAQLAQLKQQREAQAAQIKKQMADLEMAKLEKIGGAFDTWAKMPEGPGKKIYGEKFVPNLITALGYQEKIHPLNLEMMVKDEKVGSGVLAAIRSKRYSPDQLQDPDFIAKNVKDLVQLGSAEQISSFVSNNPKAVNEAYDKAQNDRQSEINSYIVQAGQDKRQKNEFDTSGDREAAKKANDLYVANQGGGTTASKEAAIALANETIRKLENGELKTGSFFKKAASLGPNAIGDLVDSDIKTQNAKILQNVNMRLATGDANPAENRVKEIERRMSVDIALSKQQNIDKIKSGLAKTLEDYDNTDKLFSKYVSGYGKQSTGGGQRDWSQVDENKRRAYLQKYPNGPDAAAIRKSLGGK